MQDNDKEVVRRHAPQADNRAEATLGAGSTPPTLLDSGGKIDPTAVGLSVFTRLLKSEGLRTALYALLRPTPYRFISIFRFKEGMATSVVHVDRTDLSQTQAAEVPDTATYCCYVRDSGSPFVTGNSQVDPRTTSHVARDTVRAYSGVPILDASGVLLGTLCHYDLEPRDPDTLDMQLLRQAADCIARSGLLPDYPQALA